MAQPYTGGIVESGQVNLDIDAPAANQGTNPEEGGVFIPTMSSPEPAVEGRGGDNAKTNKTKVAAAQQPSRRLVGRAGGN
ncbi:hypothetical protein NDU88_006021 [Pleurodeles waltl]|uniref:Uncharacterized protein n=1 Tax=Pleurodeles waltl TaxID=8319 RepID=A0AAV7WZY5_PLEWA|nr:hypothetical protein NDU88_006021 [Pleurodeles waltl]